MLQRDAFIEEITKKLSQDQNIYFLSADFGAAALDDLRERFPNNFLHLQICFDFYVNQKKVRINPDFGIAVSFLFLEAEKVFGT